MKIRVLAEETINKIAAGEVVERPSSVVKELVENSIDAGATKIDVGIKAGGKNLIRVTDDGSGMDKDDSVLAFNRHATSKIETASDLTAVSTLGFRGEALPSIAAVSKIELVTRTKEMDSAVRVRIEGGKLLEVKETGAPYGTMINVQNLFFNTPARRKFLRSNTTELSHIISTISNYSIIYTNCGFSLMHNGESIMEIFPKDTLLDRIRLLYGNEIAEGIVALDYSAKGGSTSGGERDGMSVKGYVSKPNITQSNRSNQFIFVNKRPITSRPVNYAIYEAYGNLIPKGRFPAVFLFLEISPESIDVNVHPTKREVRFSNDRFVQETVREGILDALAVKEKVTVTEPRVTGFTYAPVYEPKDSWEMLETPVIDKIVQMNNAYIITEVEDGFEIMDQHAVHERILYEKIKTSLEKKEPESQRLLIPINIELTLNEEKMLKEEIVFLTELGFNIEEFGNQTIIVDMIPAVMDKIDISSLIKDILSLPSSCAQGLGGKAVSQGDIKDGIIKFMACRAAVKQGDKLDIMEMQRLVRDWRRLSLPYTCPHGRSAVIKMSREELNRKFQRI